MTEHPHPNQTEPTHLVQLHGPDERVLVQNVTRYLVEGLQRGDGLVVIATPEHSEAFLGGLRDESGYARAVLEGRIAWLDAGDTLAGFMVNGEPHWSRFLVVVGNVLRDLQERSDGHDGVRAYGEMVGLLWAQGDHASAARLEDYWNRLIEVTGCSVFCAYPVDIFGPDFSPDVLHAVVSQHTQVVTQSDQLEVALSRALKDVLGTQVEGLRYPTPAPPDERWADRPPAEDLVFWIRRHFRDQADEIIARARDYYLAAMPETVR